MDCKENKCTFNTPSNIMMQVNMCNCTINNMQMMNLGEEEGPPTVPLYKITVLSLDGSESFNIRIDRTQKEVRLVLTKEETDTLWQIAGNVGNREIIAIGTPGGTEFWTVIVEEPSIGFRPPRSSGDKTQFFELTQTIGNQYLMLRSGNGPLDPPKNIGTNTEPKEGAVIFSDAGPTFFAFTQIMP